MHFTPVDPTRAISPDLAIVRYIKIAAFLMLSQGKVFIPSLKTLQHADPLEALLPSRVYPGYLGFHDALTQGEGFQWIQSKAQKLERKCIEKDKNSPYARGLLVQIWLRELAIRRCIWCWYAKRPESMAMWNNFGLHGIAIVSTIAGVRAALSLPDDALTSVARVNYVRGEGIQMDPQLIHPLWINRPYYFKQKAYDYEEEVRLVFACEPVYLALKGGIVRNVNPSLLIDEVLISPHIHFDEAKAIKDVILAVCPFLGSHHVTISPLLFPGDSDTREKMYERTKNIYEDMELRDLLSDRHREEDQEGVFHDLPQMMLQV